MPQPIRVLIVEDSANDADLMLSELRRGGFDSDSKRVRTADELRAALSQGSWDVVLSDFSLPGFGAAAALEMAREMAADIPFIVVSGSVGEEVAVEMMRAGANDYVLKHAMARLGPIVSRELRESKKRQAAERLSQNVLNSLSSHIAVLDQQGTIVAVNASWKLFAARHGALAEIGPGSHYLTISHLAHGPYADAAPLVADGFAKVLAGELPQFVLEYQCRAKSPTKWFLLHTTPLGTEQGGAVVSHTDITARKEAEEAMRDSDSRTQFILETSLDCIITIDSQGKITEFNPAAEKTFGYSRKSVLGLAIVDLLIPSVFREPHLRGFDHFLKTGEGPILGQRVEVTALRQDGTEFPVELTVTAVHTRGKPEFTAFLRDISERKQAEMTLRDSEERYRTLLDRIPLPLFVYDRETLQYLTVNQAAVANYGYSHDEFLQMKVTDIRPSEDVPELLDALTRTGESYEKRGIWRHRKKNGTIIQVEIAAHSLDLAGRPACIILANDVTDGLQADAEVRRTSNLLKAVADSTPDAIFVKDRQGRYLLFNPAASRFVGLPVEEVLGRDDSQLFDPVGARFVMERDRQVMDSGQTETKEERLTAAGTTRVYLATKAPYRDVDGNVAGVIGISRDITDRKRVEEDLLLFRALIDQTTDGIEVIDPETGRFLDVNQTSCLSHGYTRDEYLSLKVADVDPVVANLPWEQVITEARKSTSKIFESLHRRKDGSTFPVEVNLNFVHLDRDYLLAVVRDITEREKAEAALRQSEQRFRAIFNSMFQFTGVVTLDGILLEANQTALAACGVPPEEVLGLPFWDCWWWSNSTASQTRLKDAIHRAAAGEFVRYEVDIRGPESQTITVDFSIKPVLDESGRVTLLVPEGRDVTDQKRAEADLRLRDRAIRAVTQGILITDAGQPDNPIIYASPGFERLTGYQEDEVLGRNCRFLQGDDTDPAAVSVIRESVNAGTRCTVELLNYRKNGVPFWNELSISPVWDTADKLSHFVGVLADVTARRRLEEQLRQSQKMEAVGQLAGGVAHDFNNLLTVIIGYSDILREKLNRDDPSFGLVSEILQAGERAASLTRQLLAFSRQQVLQPIILDLNAVTREMEKMLRRLISEDIRLMVVLDPQLALVRADPGQIEQVILNLVVNAKDAMPHGGRLTIETRNVELDQAYVLTHTDLRQGDCVMLSVSDTGHGIPEEIRSRIFEPFFTTKDIGKGTGLGLATVHGILKQSGGHIDVESEVGRGTTFKVYLPRVEAPADETGRQTGIPAPPHGTETVLLVEDEPGVRALMGHVLKGCGYTLLEASSGEDAVRVVASHSEPIQLLITDVVMPGMGGWQVAGWLTKRYPEAKVLFVSGYTNDAVVRHGVQQQGVNFLQKPFSAFELAAKVRDILDVPQ